MCVCLCVDILVNYPDDKWIICTNRKREFVDDIDILEQRILLEGGSR